MAYRYTYDLSSGQVISAEEITTATIDDNDGSLFQDFCDGLCRAKVMNGVLTRDDTVVKVDENVVPTDRLADALGIEHGVGVSRETIEQLAEEANITLSTDASDILEE